MYVLPRILKTRPSKNGLNIPSTSVLVERHGHFHFFNAYHTVPLVSAPRRSRKIATTPMAEIIRTPQKLSVCAYSSSTSKRGSSTIPRPCTPAPKEFRIDVVCPNYEPLAAWDAPVRGILGDQMAPCLAYYNLLVLVAKIVQFQARQARVDQQEGRHLQISPDYRGMQGRPFETVSAGASPGHARERTRK